MRKSATIAILLALASVAPAETIRGKNFSGGTTIPLTVTRLENCNLSFQNAVFAGGKWRARTVNHPGPLVAVGCNMVNAKLPLGSTEIDPRNLTIRRSGVVATTQTVTHDFDRHTSITFAWRGREDQIIGHRQAGLSAITYMPSPVRLIGEMPTGRVVFRRIGAGPWRRVTHAMREDWMVKRAEKLAANTEMKNE